LELMAIEGFNPEEAQTMGTNESSFRRKSPA